MFLLLRAAVLTATLAFFGCSGHVGPHSAHLGFHTHPEYAQPSVIPTFGSGPVHYTSYYGSDEKWHYFETHFDLKLHRYKVPRWSLPDWRPVFPVGKGKLYVQRNTRGELMPIPPRKRR